MAYQPARKQCFTRRDGSVPRGRARKARSVRCKPPQPRLSTLIPFQIKAIGLEFVFWLWLLLATFFGFCYQIATKPVFPPCEHRLLQLLCCCFTRVREENCCQPFTRNGRHRHRGGNSRNVFPPGLQAKFLWVHSGLLSRENALQSGPREGCAGLRTRSCLDDDRGPCDPAEKENNPRASPGNLSSTFHQQPPLFAAYSLEMPSSPKEESIRYAQMACLRTRKPQVRILPGAPSCIESIIYGNWHELGGAS